MEAQELIKNLNAHKVCERLDALNELMKLAKAGKIERTPSVGFVNNHIHTIYSFSPYSPTAAVFEAWRAGLDTAGIMDHDSVSGAREFLEAGKLANMPVTVGAECRVKATGTAIDNRRINNPDQDSIIYVALHGIPHTQLDAADEFFAPKRALRNERNRKICKKINYIVGERYAIDFDDDVLPLSMYENGGSVTERHVLFALTKKLIAASDTLYKLIETLTGKLGLDVSEKVKVKLSENDPRYYAYDVLGLLKSSLVEKIYVDADEECPHVNEYIDFCKKTGAISAYAYLGDVGDSVTGDKKAQKFEDSYIDLLFETLHSLGFNAVTYMPTRNTKLQLERVIGLCHKYGLFEISGEDINSPRQSFICPSLDLPMFEHLKDSTYALIGHEYAATENCENGMFTDNTIALYPDLKERTAHFAAIGRGLK